MTTTILLAVLLLAIAFIAYLSKRESDLTEQLEKTKAELEKLKCSDKEALEENKEN